jgi:hypothetical protein
MTLTKTAIIRQKLTKFDEHSWPSNFIWNNLYSAKARPPSIWQILFTKIDPAVD